MVEIELDGQKVEVAEGSMVMHAAEKAGKFIPHFCYHKKLSIAANCRMCLVEVEKAPKPLPACATPVTQGMVVHTHSEKAVKAQKSVMEFLLINHPLDCPICDQGGECQLQDLAVGYGGTSSRYAEEKRVVFHKNIGPLISMEEMSRCIHCTRCVRFGQEVAGVMELGMAHRGEHSEIMSFVGATVDSELSGNMVDVCPVGALTNKPFRYSARTWELSRRKSVSPHDGVGANLVVQVKANHVMRVVPLENEAVNECWISDRDRYSYEALNSEQRLTQPMIKQGNEWVSTDWQTALEYVGHGLKNITKDHGPASIGALASAQSTVEELHLLAKLVRGLGSDNIDTRLRHADFHHDGVRWLGASIESLSHVQRALVVGSFLRKDQPLMALRLRHSAKHGAKIHRIDATDEDWLMSIASHTTVAPSQWVQALASVAAAVAEETGVAAPVAATVTDAARVVAKSLLGGERKAVLLGNAAAQHPQASSLLALATWIAEQTGAHCGYLTESGNTVGAQLVKALPQKAGLNAGAMLAKPLKAYVLLNTEPELEAAQASLALSSLKAAEMVVVMSAFKNPAAMAYADVLLPIAPFTETSGTFVNAEGRAQSFHAVVKPLAETRPAWKVLRVLGHILGLTGFDQETSEEVRREALGADLSLEAIQARLSNKTQAAIVVSAEASALERVADVPIYATDVLVRHAPSLQMTADAKPPVATLSHSLFEKLGLNKGDAVRVKVGQAAVVLPAVSSRTQAANVVRVPTGTAATAALDGLFGAITVEKA